VPELPEVETVRRSLLPYLPGRRIRSVEIRAPKLVIYPTMEDLVERLPGQAFERLDRKGKLLIFHLSSDVLLVHLGMTGQLTVRDPGRADQAFDRHPTTGLQRSFQHPVDQHTHINIGLDDLSLHYRDIRKFGKWRLYRPEDPALQAFVDALGPDPTTEHYVPDRFLKTVKSSKRAIKAVILDQSVVAGVGNIYADEALFAAGIRPHRLAFRLAKKRIIRLHEAIREVLSKGIENGGTSFSDYVNAEGQKGTNQETLLVYGRYGKPCYVCGTILERSDVAQRTSTWCPICQT
jgi:formamidopyrimidine-DNA glycosylase